MFQENGLESYWHNMELFTYISNSATVLRVRPNPDLHGSWRLPPMKIYVARSAYSPEMEKF